MPISYERRRRKTLAIHVNPPPSAIEVRIPLKCSWANVDRFVELKMPWILEALGKLAQRSQAGLSYLDGSSVPFMGKQRTIRVYAGRSKVSLSGDFLMVRSMYGDVPAETKKLLEKFYRQQCLPIFQARLTHCTEQFPLALKPAGLKVRKMSARWGSCSGKGEICLNTLLLRYDLETIDFVINHELCHLKHFNHSQAFYHLMDQVMPNWREIEARMNTSHYSM